MDDLIDIPSVIHTQLQVGHQNWPNFLLVLGIHCFLLLIILLVIHACLFWNSCLSFPDLAEVYHFGMLLLPTLFSLTPDISLITPATGIQTESCHCIRALEDGVMLHGDRAEINPRTVSFGVFKLLVSTFGSDGIHTLAQTRRRRTLAVPYIQEVVWVGDECLHLFQGALAQWFFIGT